jgi:hypothetical protein
MRIPIFMDEPVLALAVIVFCLWRATLLVRAFWYALKNQKVKMYG